MKKNILIVVLCVVLAAVAGAVAFVALKDSKPEETTAPTSVSETTDVNTTASVAGSVFNTTKKTAKKTTKATTADKNAFIRKGAWYLADTDNETCYALAFKKSGAVDIAYFNSDNIEGFDAQYFKGDAKYQIKGKKIIISSLPEAAQISSIELEISGKSVKYRGKALKNYKEISLDNALKCFE